MDRFTLKAVSSLEKIFYSTDPDSLRPMEKASCLKNQTLSFQLLYRFESGKPGTAGPRPCRLTLESEIAEWVRIRHVELVPAGLPCFDDTPESPRRDENIIDRGVTMYPDLLSPCSGIVLFAPGRSRSCWISIENPRGLAPGEYTLRFTAAEISGTPAAETAVHISVIDAELPGQRVHHTEWFHVDCLADYYRVKPYSEEHWRIIGNFIRLAARRSMDTLLVPVFTPSLDIAEGFERTDVQLLSITVKDGVYDFDFSRIKRYFDLSRASGIKHFEISPLFSQWGARFAPTIYADSDGEYRRIFGWDTPADSPEYRNFLRTFLPRFTRFLTDEKLKERVFFHISDEPGIDDIEAYETALKIVRPHLEDFRTIDALSDLEIYSRGLIRTPVSASNHIQPFLDARVNPLWVYYCCGQNVDVANRFIAMPSARSRIIGVQIYKFDIEGFLQWGFNFYSSQHSLRGINPFICTDADLGFPSGDAFVVYPDIDGSPLESLRLMVINEAFEDIRAFQLLESLSSKDEVIAIIEEGIEPVTFSSYPREPEYLIDLRERVNREIRRRLGYIDQGEKKANRQL